jgi:hypothetical protein
MNGLQLISSPILTCCCMGSPHAVTFLECKCFLAYLMIHAPDSGCNVMYSWPPPPLCSLFPAPKCCSEGPPQFSEEYSTACGFLAFAVTESVSMSMQDTNPTPITLVHSLSRWFYNIIKSLLYDASRLRKFNGHM